MPEKAKKNNINEQDIIKLKKKKAEIKSLVQSNEDERLSLIKQIHKLEQELLNVKDRYGHEKRLKNRSKNNLKKINKSHSWRLSLPVRMIGSFLHKITDKKSTPNYPNVNVIKEILEDRTSARDLDRKLWAGYGSYACKELKDLKESPDAPLNERLRATRSLARLYYDRKQFDDAYKELAYINEVKPLNHPNPDRVVTEIKVLKKLNDTNIAKRKVWKTIKARGLQSELCLSMAHLAENEEEKLNWYNLIYDMRGFQRIKKKDHLSSLNLGNIQTLALKNDRSLDDYKISIIIPAYKAAHLIHIPLNSLLGQTIQNIEIIVVDDHSPDDTASVVESFANKDKRIKLIKKQKNEGAYAARNTGLQHVTGDFITVHDSDDWSHPQKIEVQLKELLRNPRAVGSMSFLVRTTDDIIPLNAGSLLGSKFLMVNSSSLLVRRSIHDQLGGWDSVRVAGDTEFIWRIEKVFGKESIVRVEPSVPFSFALSNETSLTGASTTHVKTIMFGLRRTYREAFEWWHDQANSPEELYLDPKKINRNFPCPIPNRMMKPHSRIYDYIFIADFSDESDIKKLMNIINWTSEAHHQTAVFHWPDYNSDPYNKVANMVHDIVDQRNIDMLVPNEEVEAEKLVCLTPRVLDYILDSIPKIKSRQALILNHETASIENQRKRGINFRKIFQMQAEWCSLKFLINKI